MAAMGVGCARAGLLAWLLLVTAAAEVQRPESAQLLAKANEATSETDDVTAKRQRSLIPHDYGTTYPELYAPPGQPPYPVPAPPHRPAPPSYHGGVKYAPKYHRYSEGLPKYPEPHVPTYIPPVYVPRPGQAPHAAFEHPVDSFHAARLKVQEQFAPIDIHAPSREPPHYIQPSPYHPEPEPRYPVYAKPEPYAEGYRYSPYPYPEKTKYPEPEYPPQPLAGYEYHGGREAKSLDQYALDPTPFIETIAVAYHENQKNFGSRQGKAYKHAPFEKPLESRPYYRPHAPEYPEYKPKYKKTYTPEYRYKYAPEREADPVPEFPPFRVPEFTKAEEFVASKLEHRGGAVAPRHQMTQLDSSWPKQMLEDKMVKTERPPKTVAPYRAAAPGSLYSLATAGSEPAAVSMTVQQESDVTYPAEPSQVMMSKEMEVADMAMAGRSPEYVDMTEMKMMEDMELMKNMELMKEAPPKH